MNCGRLCVCLGAATALVSLGACDNTPAVLDPHGSNAREIVQIAWVLFWGGGVIFVVVMAFAACALLVQPARRAWLGSNKLVIGAGIVFPVVALSALLFYTLKVSGSAMREKETAQLKIEIVGEMWWWRVRYVDAAGATMLVTANEIHVPVGSTIELALESADVLHSFWVPNLAGKLDLIPGRTNTLRVKADRAGVFRGQCAEFCGVQHAKMALYVVAQTPIEFESWLARQQLPAVTPQTAAHKQGHALFDANCGACHAVRGTSAAGQLGPDLTHVGSRLTLGAGTLPNNAGTIAGWIAASQHLKPGNKMPSFERFTGEELHALAGYVQSLQ